MPVIVYEQATEFVAVAEEYLLRDEVANSLMIGITQRVAHGGEYSQEVPFFATITDSDGALAGAAAMTPPHEVILSLGTASGALPDLIAILRDDNWSVSGVIGPKDEAGAFAAAWKHVTGQPTRVGMNQRSYVLRAVTAPTRPASGQLRPAGFADMDLVTTWIRAFGEEAIPDDPPSDSRLVAEQRIEAGDIFIWEDGGEPVSMAAKARPAGRGITVNLVYTPLKHRRKGYASVCVAALSQFCLDMGYSYCTLFTDLDNPTSNDIYVQLGYKPVCDFMLIRFGGK